MELESSPRGHKSLDIVGEGAIRQMTYNATGVKVDMDEAHAIGTRIRDEYLPKLAPNKRIFANLSITAEPDDMSIRRDGDEQWKNYSVTHDWLADFADFCLKSKGFQVF
ncbi:MAG: hypothetical protein IPK98_04815 [Chloracidobacterium sp.]|nr:hypothetical protein [Chloracidobacterium sp.]